MDRGDIYFVDLDPTKGIEQRGKRPVLIVSTTESNKLSPAIVCPVASAAVGQRLPAGHSGIRRNAPGYEKVALSSADCCGGQ